jgi:hypothetical protein
LAQKLGDKSTRLDGQFAPGYFPYPPAWQSQNPNKIDVTTPSKLGIELAQTLLVASATIARSKSARAVTATLKKEEVAAFGNSDTELGTL